MNVAAYSPEEFQGIFLTEGDPHVILNPRLSGIIHEDTGDELVLDNPLCLILVNISC